MLLLAVHLGENALHLDEWWGQRVNVHFAFFQTHELVGYLEAAGWHIEETTERDPCFWSRLNRLTPSLRTTSGHE